MIVDYEVLPPSDSKYPANLINIIHSKTLYTLGNIALLSKKAIGICGSRSASSEALSWAYKFGAEAAKRGLVVVSGNARGVDRQAHKGAVAEGGCTIAVLPEGINNFKINRELEPLARLEDNFLAVSMFEPDAVWKSWRAMERNKLIVGLAVGLFVVEARDTGGTINAAMECVRQEKPLWAIAYSDDTPERQGNQILLQGAAIPLRRFGDLKQAMEHAASVSEDVVKQLALDLV